MHYGNYATNLFFLIKDKGQGIVLINHDDCINSLHKIFDDSTKFKKLTKDPTITRLTTVQNYLNALFKRGELNESDKKAMRPKSAQIARAHGLPKTHKHYECLPKFRPIIDTTSTPYYGISKFLSSLLNPLIENEYIAQDSFCAAKKMREIPKELFEVGYRFVSFDGEPLFTGIPLSRTIKIILDRIYNQNIKKYY